MEIVVLAKVVPDSDLAGVDPVHRTLRRDAGALFLNPFDQRALRAAIELRRAGDRVTVVSMGPPAVESAIAETLGLGADHAVLVSDPALAGSDTLVTARVLARLVEERGSGYILTGLWSTDSETGQVPAELAARLGLPLVRGARRLRWSPAGIGLEATVDTDEGSARVTVQGLAVVTVGEKIGKPLKPGEAHRASAEPGQLVRQDLASLGFSPEEVGRAGSPTEVARLVDRSPRRSGLRFEVGEPSERVAGALAALRDLFSRRPDPPGAGEAPGPSARPGTVAVLVTDEEGGLEPSAASLLHRARRQLPFEDRIALWISPDPPTPADLGALAGVGRVVLFRAERGWSARTAATALTLWFEGVEELQAVLVPATGFGREVAGRWAGSLELGLVGDVIELGASADGAIVCQKPSFGGGIVAEIRTRTVPLLATLRAERIDDAGPSSAPPSRLVAGGPVPADPSLRWSDRVRDPPDGLADPDRASIVLAVGVGASSPTAMAAARHAAATWGAALVGTRRVVDAGILPLRRQVGLTGRSIAADLGVLLGVRGSPNHLIGWRRTRALLAVNPEPSAPVFEGADVGIVGRWEEVLPLLEPELLGVVRPG